MGKTWENVEKHEKAMENVGKPSKSHQKAMENVGKHGENHEKTMDNVDEVGKKLVGFHGGF